MKALYSSELHTESIKPQKAVKIIMQSVLTIEICHKRVL